MNQKKIEVIVTDQPESALISKELITRTRRKKFHREISALVKDRAADFHGRAWNKNNGVVYQIFTLEGKRIFVDDPDATLVMESLFDSDGQLREMEIK